MPTLADPIEVLPTRRPNASGINEVLAEQPHTDDDRVARVLGAAGIRTGAFHVARHSADRDDMLRTGRNPEAARHFQGARPTATDGHVTDAAERVAVRRHLADGNQIRTLGDYTPSTETIELWSHLGTGPATEQDQQAQKRGRTLLDTVKFFLRRRG